jgi:hypothetical protein
VKLLALIRAAADVLYYLEQHQSASGRSLLNSSKDCNQTRSAAYLVTQWRNAQIKEPPGVADGSSQ